MAEIQPLRTLRYDLRSVGSLDAVAAPPYDVIDAQMRAELAARSPINVVEIDLPEGPNGADPYQHAQETLEEWTHQGVLVREREPALWVLTQDYTGPDGNAYTRHGFFARVRVEDYGPGRIRPHERTQPGPKEDRLNLTRATRANLSPIFSLFPDRGGDAWKALEPATAEEPFDTVTDADGTINRLWRVAEPGTIERVQGALAERAPPPAPRRAGHDRARAGGARRARAPDRRRPPPLRDRPRVRAGDRRRGRALLRPDVPLRARGPGPDDLPHPPPAQARLADA